MSQFFNINNTVVIRQIRKANEQNKNPPCRFKASGDWHPWQYFLWYAWIPDQLLKGQVFCKGFGSVDLSQVKLNIKAGACLCTVIDNIRDGQNFICPLKKSQDLEIAASSKASLFADAMMERSSSSPPPAMNCQMPISLLRNKQNCTWSSCMQYGMTKT